MGAFGQNTMTFDQWMQFVLIPRLRTIVADREEFPEDSQLAAYAIREMDGDPDPGDIHALLYAIDGLVDLANGRPRKNDELDELVTEDDGDGAPVPPADSISLGDDTLPPVVSSLLDVLPGFEGNDLEDQLQTYDTFLAILSPAVRPELSALLRSAATKATNPDSRARIEQAADAVARGDRAAAPSSGTL